MILAINLTLLPGCKSAGHSPSTPAPTAPQRNNAPTPQIPDGCLEERPFPLDCPPLNVMAPVTVNAEGTLGNWRYKLAQRHGTGLATSTTMTLCARGTSDTPREFASETDESWASLADGCLGADIDRDGAPDLVVLVNSGGSRCCNTLVVLGLRDDGVKQSGGDDLNQVPQCADVDGDGQPELVWQHPMFFETPDGKPCAQYVPVVAGFLPDGRLVNRVRHYPALLKRNLDRLRVDRQAHAREGDGSWCQVAEAALLYLLGNESAALGMRLAGSSPGADRDEFRRAFLWDMNVGWLNHRWSDDPPLVRGQDLPPGDLAPTTEEELRHNRDGGG